MNNHPLQEALLALPDNALESIISSIFMPSLFKALGFEPVEYIPQYFTGNGTVDYAARHNTPNDIFVQTKSNPHLLIELKSRNINLSDGSTQYNSTIKQIQNYLGADAKNCQSVEWGIITNSKNIQLFRRHGKLIYPATLNIEITASNILEVVTDIKQKIENPQRSLTVAVYNNKGGVGKTTTTINLAAALTWMDKKVLIIDFDPNQRDLTNSLGIKNLTEIFYNCLEDKENRVDISTAIIPFKAKSPKSSKQLIFDVIPADNKLFDTDESKLRQEIKINRLRQVLVGLKNQYDYILIDAPPNWRFFSQSAVCAADVVLIPTKHNSMSSLENAAITISQFIPEIQEYRKDGSPIALPIFFNGEKITEAAKIVAQKELDNIINRFKHDHNFNLLPYIYPRYTPAAKKRDIFELPSYASIAGAVFSRTPAAYKDKTAYDYYKNLAKEHFVL